MIRGTPVEPQNYTLPLARIFESEMLDLASSLISPLADGLVHRISLSTDNLFLLAGLRRHEK